MKDEIHLGPETGAPVLQEKNPPWDDPHWWLCRWVRDPAFYVFLHQKALRDLVIHSHSDTTREVAGALIGVFCSYQDRRFIEIHAAIPGPATKGSLTEVTFTADTWSAILAARNEKYPQYWIIGWYHTHPGHGIFLSDKDLFIHNHFFRVTDLALVIDPLNLQGQFFRGHGLSSESGMRSSILFQWPASEVI